MTSFTRTFPALFGAGAVLAACASTPVAPPPHAGRPPAPAPKPPPVVTMAPIANPPEEERRERPAREQAEREHPAPLRSEAKPEAAAPPARPAPSAPAAAGHDPERAAILRTRGLTRLNSGQVDRAVALLQEASRLDPDSALIKKDLERALRISRLVHAGNPTQPRR